MPYVKFALYLIPYLAFLYWVESWWGLIVVPFIFDICFTKKIKWGWWKEPEVGPATRFIMSWVDAIVFALIGVYFLTQFFFQNFVIPSSSLEKTLLTGDYLLVSKLAYGPRIPQTPLTMPMTQHTLPIINCKSYIEHPHWDYRRVKGLGNVEVNDIVVFNYPAGDTVALAQQNQDYYRLAYQIGDQLLGTQTADTTSIFPQTIVIPATASLLPETSYEEQQRIYNNVYAAGAAYMRQHPEEFGGITSRPTDRRENYVKRCVGLPGQTLQIKNDTVYLDGKPNPEPENVQYAYEVTFKQDLPDELKRELGITEEDLYAQRNGNTVWMPLTHKVRKQLEARKDIVASIARAVPDAGWLYPQNMAKDWTTANYGPLWIPKKGETLRLTLANLPIYERPIRVYEGNSLEVRGGKIFINGKGADSYTFKLDYYWMQGDNRDNSVDSRYWITTNYVSKDKLVGKVLFRYFPFDNFGKLE